MYISGVSAVGSATETIMMKLYDFKHLGLGAYGIGNGVINAHARAFIAIGKDTTYATSGRVMIEEQIYNGPGYYNRVKGTFNFQSDSIKADSMSVLNGAFTCALQSYTW
jgi:hypothetical protein